MINAKRTPRVRTRLDRIELGFVEDATRPIVGYALDVEDACCAEPHAHPRAQVIFASAGVMRVLVPGNRWFVPPSQAVYVPPLFEHEVQFPGKVAIRNLFIDQSAAAILPSSCRVIAVTALLRELIMRFVGMVPNEAGGPRGARISAVILDELAGAASSPRNLPTSTEPHLTRVMEALLTAPGDNRSLDEWARVANASARTLARLFLRETGMTFADWRLRLRMLEALDRLTKGTSVTAIALDLGYSAPSAFIAAFRSHFGTSPSRFRSLA